VGHSSGHSLATLIYAVVNSRMDYCNTVLVGAPRTVTDKLQRVLNAAAPVITGTRKFDRGLGQILHDQLHWLDVPGQVLNTYGRRAFSVAGPWPGTHSRILSWIQRAAQTVLGVYLKRTCSRVAPAHLGFLTIMRYINPHSLTHSSSVAQ